MNPPPSPTNNTDHDAIAGLHAGFDARGTPPRHTASDPSPPLPSNPTIQPLLPHDSLGFVSSCESPSTRKRIDNRPSPSRRITTSSSNASNEATVTCASSSLPSPPTLPTPRVLDAHSVVTNSQPSEGPSPAVASSKRKRSQATKSSSRPGAGPSKAVPAKNLYDESCI